MNISEERLKTLSQLAYYMKEEQEEIERLEALLEASKRRYSDLSEVEIPQLMNDIGVQQFRLSDGTKFEIRPVLKVSPDKSNMDAVDDWLTEHGHGGMVKTKIDISLPKSSSRLEEVKEALYEMGIEYTVSKTIHPQTLWKWGREMEDEGMVIPEDLFSIYRSYKTIIG